MIILPQVDTTTPFSITTADLSVNKPTPPTRPTGTGCGLEVFESPSADLANSAKSRRLTNVLNIPTSEITVNQRNPQNR